MNVDFDVVKAICKSKIADYQYKASYEKVNCDNEVMCFYYNCHASAISDLLICFEELDK